MTAQLPIGVVGGGIVGLAVARELLRREPGRPLVVFEKEAEIARHQTGNNSGVVHAGIYYRPGSLKARLCAEGRGLLKEFCHAHDLAFDECGKLVVAVERDELDRLDALESSATANEVPGLRRLDADAISEIEPAAEGLAALHSPQTAICDYSAIAKAMAADVVAGGGEVRLSTPISRIRHAPGAAQVSTPTGPIRLDRLIVCGGVQSDRLRPPGRLVRPGQNRGRTSARIVPFRGEYMSVVGAKAGLVRGMVYPVPDPRYPFLGVHFTRTVAGGLEVGPNAVLALHREGRRPTSIDVADMAATLSWPGFWRLAGAHWQTGLDELAGSMSVSRYMRRAQRYVPAIGADDVVRSGAGIRAQALDRDGSLVDDFRIEIEDRIVAVVNAPSPAATSSLAIARHLADQLDQPGRSS